MTDPPEDNSELRSLVEELMGLSETELETRLAELSPEQRNQLVNFAAALEAEHFFGEDERPAQHEPRLGKIERFILVYMVRPRYSPLYPGYALHARSCALQSYYREAHGLPGRQTRNVKQLVIDKREYNSLQVRFTKAMQRLETKGLIETFRVRRSRYFADRGRGPEPAEVRSKRLYVGEFEVGRRYKGKVVAEPIVSHKCCNRYRTVYWLTSAGREKAREIVRREGWYSSS